MDHPYFLLINQIDNSFQAAVNQRTLINIEKRPLNESGL